MSRSISAIYNEAVQKRNEYLELSEIDNDSKMSVMNAFTWVVSAAIYTYENILDVFTADIVGVLNDRINGTPAYYVNALKKYQDGDELSINDDGTKFGYVNEDVTKRIIKRAAYEEYLNSDRGETSLLLKIAKDNGDSGLCEFDYDTLTKIRAYIDQIKFAGTFIKVVSRKGDVLVPRVTVYHDGAVSEDEVYTNIENALKKYIVNLDFNGKIYSTNIIDAIQQAEHVVDVYIDPGAIQKQGFYIAKYNDDGIIGELQDIGRSTIANSGYFTESSRADAESEIPKWRETIILKVEK